MRPVPPSAGGSGLLGSARDLQRDQLGTYAEAMAGRAVDLHQVSMRCALHALGHTVFGNDMVDVAPTLREVLPPLGDHLKRRSLAPVRSPHWWPSPANRRAERVRKVVWGLADALIAERRAEGAHGDDLLSRLLAARDPETGQGLADADVRDEAIIFLIAGHETTGSALAFTLFLLGRHPDVQERVCDDAGEAAGDEDPPHYDLDRLPYPWRSSWPRSPQSSGATASSPSSTRRALEVDLALRPRGSLPCRLEPVGAPA